MDVLNVTLNVRDKQITLDKDEQETRQGPKEVEVRWGKVRGIGRMG